MSSAGTSRAFTAIFAYPLDHLTGWLTLKKNLLTVNLETLVGGSPCT